jgi:hypothetical protein
MALRLSTDTRNKACDAIVDDIDAGSAAGTILIYNNAQVGSVGGSEAGNTLLATLTFSDPAFGASSTGVATASAITSDTDADASGTAGHAVIKDSDANVVADCTCGQGAGDINFDDNTLVFEGTVAISSMTITVPIS